MVGIPDHNPTMIISEPLWQLCMNLEVGFWLEVRITCLYLIIHSPLMFIPWSNYEFANGKLLLKMLPQNWIAGVNQHFVSNNLFKSNINIEF